MMMERLMRLCLALFPMIALAGCVAPGPPEQLAASTAVGSPTTRPPAGRRIASDGAGNFILPDGSVVSGDGSGGFTLPNGAYVAADGSGSVRLPNGATCVSDRAG